MQEAPNLNYIKELAGDDISFEKRFIKILKDEFPEETKEYYDYMEKEQLHDAAELVHKLKHKFNILSLSDAYVFAVSYEEELKLGNRSKDINFRKILDTIKIYLKTI